MTSSSERSGFGDAAQMLDWVMPQVRKQLELELQIEVGAEWLVMSALRKRSVDVFAALTRMSPQRITDMHVPSAWEGKRKHFCYCARCMFLNPMDVTVPIWRWEWLDRNLSGCATHGDAFQTLSCGRVLACRNFGQLFQIVCRQERELRNEILWQLR